MAKITSRVAAIGLGIVFAIGANLTVSAQAPVPVRKEPPPPPVAANGFDGVTINISGSFPATGSFSTFSISEVVSVKGNQVTYNFDGQLTGTVSSGGSQTTSKPSFCNGNPDAAPLVYTVSASFTGNTLQLATSSQNAVTSGPCKGDVNTLEVRLTITLTNQTCTFSYSVAQELKEVAAQLDKKSNVNISQQPCKATFPAKPPATVPPHTAARGVPCTNSNGCSPPQVPPPSGSTPVTIGAPTGQPPAPAPVPPPTQTRRPATQQELDALANGQCPTNSRSDVTGLGPSSSNTPPSPLTAPPSCRYLGQTTRVSYTNPGPATVPYTTWNGIILPIPPGYGLWIQNGILEVQKPDTAHPSDTLYSSSRPPIESQNPDVKCVDSLDYLMGNNSASGWVALGCQVGRDRDQLLRANLNKLCRAACEKGYAGQVIQPNNGAKITMDDCLKVGGIPQTHPNPQAPDNDPNVIMATNGGWPDATIWCADKNVAQWLKIRNENEPDLVCWDRQTASYYQMRPDNDPVCTKTQDDIFKDNPFGPPIPQ